MHSRMRRRVESLIEVLFVIVIFYSCLGCYC